MATDEIIFARIVKLTSKHPGWRIEFLDDAWNRVFIVAIHAWNEKAVMVRRAIPHIQLVLCLIRPEAVISNVIDEMEAQVEQELKLTSNPVAPT